jgi:molybdopterin converting factor small subunit
MVVLRLFAGAREAAGTGRVELEGATVGAVLDRAVSRFGPAFAAILETSQVWLNGDPTDRSAAAADNDEVAVLPPVSGG